MPPMQMPNQEPQPMAQGLTQPVDPQQQQQPQQPDAGPSQPNDQVMAVLGERMQSLSPQDAQALQSLPPELMAVIGKVVPELAAMLGGGQQQPAMGPAATPPRDGAADMPGYSMPRSQTMLGQM